MKELILRSKRAPLHITAYRVTPEALFDPVFSQLCRIQTLQLVIDPTLPYVSIPLPFNAVGHRPHAEHDRLKWPQDTSSHPPIAGMAAGLLIAARPPARRQVEAAAARFRALRQSPLPDVGLAAKRGLQRAVSAGCRLDEGN